MDVGKDAKGSHVEDQKKDELETSQHAWSSIFGRNPRQNSCWEKDEFQIFILDLIVDYSISTMEFTLVGKFLGAHLEVDGLRNIVKRKWAICEQVDIVLMMNGFFSFVFTCKEDLNMVLCGGPLMI